MSRLSFFLLRSRSGHFGARAASDHGVKGRKPHLLSRKWIQEHLLVWKRGGDFISGFSQWHMVRTLALTLIPLLGAEPGMPALPLSVLYQLLGEESKCGWMWAGSKVRGETLAFLQEVPTASPQKPPIL